MNDYLFSMINGWAGQYPLIDSLMINITSYGPYVFAGILILFLVSKSSRVTGIIGFGAVIFAMGVNYVIKFLFFRPRPFVQDQVNLLLDHAPDSSFPSNHTMAAVTIACVLWSYNRKLGSLLIGLAVLLGISRIYVGHHYPLDVLAGLFFGLICAAIVLKVGRRIFGVQRDRSRRGGRTRINQTEDSSGLS